MRQKRNKYLKTRIWWKATQKESRKRRNKKRKDRTERKKEEKEW
jgi:hypothetical protein